jgi:hypothetical protein
MSFWLSTFIKKIQARLRLKKASNFALRIGAIASDICQQMSGREIGFREQFLMGILDRQAMILRDVSFLLRRNSDRNMTSVFILFRCLLDDYLTLLYFANSNFDEESFIKHTANAHSKKLSMLSESRKINERFFNGANPDLATAAMEQLEREEFRNNPTNAIYYTDNARTTMKGFPPTSQIVGALTVNAENISAAHSFAVWKLLSTYVHYSQITYQITKSKEVREIEIYQLPEILFYCLRCVALAHHALKNIFGFPVEFNDNTNVIDEITNGFNDLRQE